MTCKQGRLQERHLIILLFGPLFFDIIRSARIEYTYCMHYKCTIMAGKPTVENSPTIKERNKDYGES